MTAAPRCHVCQDYVRTWTNGMGRVFVSCPHCDEGKPHSRPAVVARLLFETAHLDRGIYVDRTRKCVRCGHSPCRGKFSKYCSDECHMKDYRQRKISAQRTA